MNVTMVFIKVVEFCLKNKQTNNNNKKTASQLTSTLSPLWFRLENRVTDAITQA